jgi:hypothetical protein
MEQYIRTHIDSVDFVACLNGLRELSRNEAAIDAQVIAISNNESTIIDALLHNLRYWVQIDKKVALFTVTSR